MLGTWTPADERTRDPERVGNVGPAFVPLSTVQVYDDPEQLSISCLSAVLDRETSGPSSAVVRGTAIVVPPPVCNTDWFGDLTFNGKQMPSVIRANRWVMRAIDTFASSFPRQVLGDALALEAAVQLHVIRPTATKSLSLAAHGSNSLPAYRAVALIRKYFVSGGNPRLTSDACMGAVPKFETPGDAFMFDPARSALDWEQAHLQAGAEYGALLVAVVDLWPLTRPH